tara:strand:+ start:2747 stop:4819 length:2073 start_codon:yes stop_codon:yes gene_type:complete
MKIFIGDLAHSTIIITNNHTPLNIGFIAAYIKSILKDKVDIRLYKNPDKLLDDIKKDPPDILGLSNYIWCQSVSEDIFQFYKKIKKDGIAVWGGPNFPVNELYKAKQYLIDRPYVDFYIPFEGETPFLNIAKAILQFGNEVKGLKSLHPECFDGSFFISANNELIGNNIGVQIKDINTIPSPYLNGWLDSFLKQGLHPMFETRRGCPFRCSYCHTGLSHYNLGRTFSLDRIKKEIEYITKVFPDPTKAHLSITDSNFGMWPQDLEFVKWLNNHTERTGFPLSINSSTGKGRTELVLDTVMSHPKLTLTNSVQSLDENVLKAINRINLPFDQLKYSQAEIDKKGKISTPEIILGLPVETRESHLNTLRKIINIGSNLITQYTLMLLPGTEIYTDESREEYKYVAKYRLIPTQFGEYEGKRCFEIEEVSVGTRDLSFEEYLEMRVVFFFIQNVYSNNIYRPLINYLIYLGEDIIDFFSYLLKKRKEFGDEFPNKVIENYINDTKGELFNSKEELVAYYSDDNNYKDLLSGKKGINLSHTYRSVVFCNAKEWGDFVTSIFHEYLQEKYPSSNEILKIGNSIISHIKAQAECQYKFFQDRKNIPTKKNPIKAELDFDIPKILSNRIDKVKYPSFKEEKVAYSYFMRDDAIDHIKSFPEDQGRVNLALIILRMDISYSFPVYLKVENMQKIEDKQ